MKEVLARIIEKISDNEAVQTVARVIQQSRPTDVESDVLVSNPGLISYAPSPSIAVTNSRTKTFFVGFLWREAGENMRATYYIA
ncbi:hypothetical protein PM082_009585 [Marasmius tenuissimus]|nr:hypothetical protein PM082_009585 [Marasmius tenuissimus]